MGVGPAIVRSFLAFNFAINQDIYDPGRLEGNQADDIQVATARNPTADYNVSTNHSYSRVSSMNASVFCGNNEQNIIKKVNFLPCSEYSRHLPHVEDDRGRGREEDVAELARQLDVDRGHV